MPYAIYILECADGSYYTGLTRDLDARAHEHRMGAHPESYTFGRRPVELVWYEVVESYQEAFQWEHQIKGWNRSKKEALIRGDVEEIHHIVNTERKRREKNKSKPNSRAERNEVETKRDNL